MAQVVKPKLSNASGNIKINNYSYQNQNVAIGNIANAGVLSSNSSSPIVNSNYSLEGQIISPKLTDILSSQEGVVQSTIGIFDQIDENGEVVGPSGQSGATPAGNINTEITEEANAKPKPGDSDFVGPLMPEDKKPSKEEPKKEEPKKEEKPKEEAKKEEPTTKKEEKPKEEPKKEEPATKKEEKPKEEPKKEEPTTKKEEPKKEEPQKKEQPAKKGKTTEIPNSVKQTGIIANYTQNYDNRGWAWDQGKMANAYKKAGSQSDGNMATIDGRYLVAVSPRFGKVGDNIDIQLENGKVIHAVIADLKGNDATSSWGHELGGKVDVVEWEINGTSQAALSKNLKDKGWYGSPVASITNTGSGNYF